MTHYRLEGEINWNHDTTLVSEALGIDDDKLTWITKYIFATAKKCNKISELLKNILEDNKLTLPEKVLAIFLTGRLLDEIVFAVTISEEDNTTTII